MQTRNPSPAQTDARRENSRKSTGPRSCRGKRHSRRNALKHGLYSDVQYFCQEAAMELGEDPGQFRRLYLGLLEARRPADALEQVLVEDITVLIWKKARLERSEAAVQVCNVRKHDLERRKQFMQVGHDGTTMSQAEMLEKGLRVTLDAPGKFEKVLEMLGMLEDLTERNEFSDDMHRLLLALYGQQPTVRGAGLLNGFVKLRKLRAEGQDLGDVKRVFEMTQAEETEEVLGEYELFLHEHVENTRAARIAAMAPSHAQWAAIIRQSNALHRQMERKIRLLDEMQERRRRLGSATDLLSRLAGQYDPSGDAGGRPAPTTPAAEVGAVREPPLPEPEGSLEPTGVAHTSRRVWSGCMRRSPQTGQERDADMPDGGTSAPPPESTIPPRPLGGEGSGGEGVLVAAPGQPQGLPLRPAENTQNRGNEAKNSLKTKEDAKTMRAKPTHSCARNVSKEARERGFRCNVRRSVGRIQPRVGVAKARAPYFMGRGESIHDRLWRRRTS
jgi:hypothetical protein